MSAPGPSNPARSIFARIIDGEIPSHRVHEDDLVVAFLDVGPLSRGHLLVVPREQKAQMHELSDESAAAIGRVLPRLCRALLEVTGCRAYNILQNNGAAAGQVVMHAHVHLIPRFEDGAGLAVQWRPGRLDEAEGAALAQALRRSLQQQARR